MENCQSGRPTEPPPAGDSQHDRVRRAGTGYFLDVEWDREALARYGLSLDEAQDLVQNAIGGRR